MPWPGSNCFSMLITGTFHCLAKVLWTPEILGGVQNSTTVPIETGPVHLPCLLHLYLKISVYEILWSPSASGDVKSANTWWMPWNNSCLWGYKLCSIIVYQLPVYPFARQAVRRGPFIHQEFLVLEIWVALCKKVPNVLCRCQAKRRMGRTYLSFGMTLTFQKKKKTKKNSKKK